MKLVKRLCRLFCGALLAFGVLSCTSEGEPAQHRNFDLVLSAPKVAALKRQALAGNGPAAYELYLHYSVGYVDEREGTLWLRLACRLREPRATKLVRMMRDSQPDEYAEFMRESRLPSR